MLRISTNLTKIILKKSENKKRPSFIVPLIKGDKPVPPERSGSGRGFGVAQRAGLV
jgi:hypothetical protein